MPSVRSPSLVNVNDDRDSYLLSLQALELASDRVQAACQGNDIKAAAIEAHFGLHAVYDLHEAYFRPRKIKGYQLWARFLVRRTVVPWAGWRLLVASGHITSSLSQGRVGLGIIRTVWALTVPAGSGRSTAGALPSSSSAQLGTRSV